MCKPVFLELSHRIENVIRYLDNRAYSYFGAVTGKTVSRRTYVLFNLRNTVIFAAADNRLSSSPVNCSFAYPVSATVVSSDDRAISRYVFTIKRRSCPSSPSLFTGFCTRAQLNRRSANIRICARRKVRIAAAIFVKAGDDTLGKTGPTARLLRAAEHVESRRKVMSNISPYMSIPWYLEKSPESYDYYIIRQTHRNSEVDKWLKTTTQMFFF